MDSSGETDIPRHIRVLVDQVPSMLAYWDRDLRCRFANRAYEHWFGVDPDTLVGTSIRDLLGPQLFALNEPYIRAVLDGAAQLFERVVPGPEGVQRHSLASYVPDIVDGQVVGFIAHVTDVAPLKATEHTLRAEAAQREIAMTELRESKASLVEAQRLGGVGNWEWEIAPDQTRWSDELYRIFGRDRTRLPPTFAEHPLLYREESWSRLQAAVQTALRTGEPYTLELEYLRPDGQSGWLEGRGEAVRNEAGDITKLRGTVHEITLRHQIEAMRVKSRTAEAASRHKSQLLARVSHELRTPLNAILGFSQLCEMDGSMDEKHAQWVAMIATAGRHMLELVDEVLDLADAESGGSDFKNLVIELNEIRDASLEQAAAAAGAGDIRLFGAGPDEARILVRGDPRRLRQVLDHLLANAIKFTQPGGSVSMTISALDDRVELSIHDTGPGLSAEQIERMFMPFERLGAERSSTPGTGLGLALAKSLVERMEGSLRVESLPGAGSKFVVSLARARFEENPALDS